MAVTSETFDQELEEIKIAAKEIFCQDAFALFSGRLDQWNFKAADMQLQNFLRDKSTIQVGDIDATWPTLGSQKFIDKMEQKINDYVVTRAVIAKWNAFLHRHGGMLRLDWRYRDPTRV